MRKQSDVPLLPRMYVCTFLFHTSRPIQQANTQTNKQRDGQTDKKQAQATTTPNIQILHYLLTTSFAM